MAINAEQIKELREKCGAGVMECRNALVDANGNVEKAQEILREKGLVKAAKKAERETVQGIVESYIHTQGRIGALVELNCETDFVARTDAFKELAHNLAMQVAAMCPLYLSEEDRPADCEVEAANACLLLQPYIKDPSKTINGLIIETVAKVGENIRLKRFARFELGG
ncbi:translation elongation factor Ts [Dehalococcoides mccartyi]|uniref:Elongation factor Ts n=1 Tax=Dehalococcoides mccartyi (strain VS) TaxID=311424 RepID=D2BGM9_DEHMV|nr:translation elongation factor Ts [Dehalococcoides mccartyi]ACZ61479.1 translation elongation factor Ts [Dehalococcoides mccartyi VS]AHB13084.1 translation elongation factor Ts [Dehalococcoides mccartyi GY50]AII57527.1 elongation factor Ts [Dehalococcoides mccartyi CG1]APH12018.1 elongation factor Ts [Dehalococcoides mccartyi]